MNKKSNPRYAITSISLFFALVVSLGCNEHRNFERRERSYELGKEILAHTGGQMVEATDSIGTRTYQGGHLWLDPLYEKGLTRELLFIGVSGKVLEVMYREFSIDIQTEYVRQPYTGTVRPEKVDRSGIARPAFYLTMKFDLSKATEFVCKDWRIKVTGVGSSSIKFVVLEEIGKYASGRSAPPPRPSIDEDVVVPYEDMK